MVALLMVNVSAAAEDTSEKTIAKAHYTAGATYYKTKRYREAVTEFLEAFRLSSQPDLLYNIGLCYLELDNPGQATDYYNRYLELRPNASERDTIQASLYRMSPRVGRLIINAALPDGEVWIDGERVAHPKTIQLLSAGHHKIELRHPQYPVTAMTIEIAGATTRQVTLQPVLGPLQGSPSVPMVESTSGVSRRRWFWPVVGGSAAILITAIVVTALLIPAGNDFAAQGRTMCGSLSNCAVIEALSR